MSVVTITIKEGILHSLPKDMEQTLRSEPNILAFWNKLTAIQRNEWICWVTIVKKPQTRTKRLQRMLQELGEGTKQPCCWPGCPHHRPKAQKWFKNV